jgi:hypothetical protein
MEEEEVEDELPELLTEPPVAVALPPVALALDAALTLPLMPFTVLLVVLFVIHVFVVVSH